MSGAQPDISLVILELGAAIVGLAILARLANRWGFSSIPLYLLGGLAFGNGGLMPLGLSENFIYIGGEIGVLLLLFMLGLESKTDELRIRLRAGIPAAALDFLLNFTPGLAAGLLLGWNSLGAILLGGVTWISSSGVVAKVIHDLGRKDNPETPLIISILVLEDLAMAIYLPLIAALVTGGGAAMIAGSISVAMIAVAVVFYAAFRYNAIISRLIGHESDEVLLLTIFGTVLLVAGLAHRVNVSSAVGAFLVGVALSGPIATQSHRLLAPLRDLFAATFFFFFGLEINPASLPAVFVPAALLAIVTGGTKFLTGYLSSRHVAVNRAGRIRTGMTLVARGEFSIVIAGLGAAVEPELIPVAAGYVLLMAIAGPVLARLR